MYEIKYRMPEEMRDSGVEWLGVIPQNWSITKNKYIADIKTGSKDTQDSIEGGAYPFFVRSKNIEHINSYSYNGEAILTPGDGDIGGIFHYIDGKFDYHQRVYKYSDFKNYSGKFLYYFLLIFFKQKVMGLSAKSTVDSLRLPMLLDFECIKNDKKEQQKIANFLDIKTAQFDSIISKKEKLIEKLEEAKKSLISEVVTGKIKIVDGELVERKPEEIKDSGVEWLGMIPREWEVKRIKNIFELRNERNYKSMEEVQLLTLYTAEGVRRQEDVESRTGNIVRTVQDYKIVHRNDVIVNIILAWQGAIGYSKYSGVISPAYDIYKPHSYVNSEYYNYLFRTSKFSGECFRYGRGIMLMRWRTYSDEFRSIFVCTPPKREQDKISSFLNNNGIHMQNFIEKNKKQIEKLKQAKQSLISEAVTGKIDLRNWEVQEVEE